MRKNLLVASCGIFFLVGADHVSAEHVSSPILKLCEAADFNAAGTPTTDAHAGPPTDAPTEPRTDRGTEKAQAKPIRSTEDVVLSERLQDLIANKLSNTWRARRTEPPSRRFIVGATLPHSG